MKNFQTNREMKECEESRCDVIYNLLLVVTHIYDDVDCHRQCACRRFERPKEKSLLIDRNRWKIFNSLFKPNLIIQTMVYPCRGIPWFELFECYNMISFNFPYADWTNERCCHHFIFVFVEFEFYLFDFNCNEYYRYYPCVPLMLLFIVKWTTLHFTYLCLCPFRVLLL